MSQSPFTTTNSRVVYANPWITVREDQVIRPGGQPGIFGVIEMIPGSTILALTEDRQVFMTKEYKYGVGREVIELISGGLEKGEEPLAGAKRELEEEVGYVANRWIDAGKTDPFTTVVSSQNYLFIALDLQKTRQKLDEGEILKYYLVSLEKAADMVMKSEITHGASCILILKAKEMLRNGTLH